MGRRSWVTLVLAAALLAVDATRAMETKAAAHEGQATASFTPTPTEVHALPARAVEATAGQGTSSQMSSARVPSEVAEAIAVLRDDKRPSSHRSALWTLAVDGGDEALDAVFDVFANRRSLDDASDAALCLAANPSPAVLHRLDALCVRGAAAVRVSSLQVVVRVLRQSEDEAILAQAREVLSRNLGEVTYVASQSPFGPLRKTAERLSSEATSLGFYSKVDIR